MASDVAAAALGASFGEAFVLLHVSVKYVVCKVRMFKPILKRLESALNRLTPTVNQISELSEQLEFPEEETKRLMEQMQDGEKLVRRCLKIRWWNYVLKFKYSTKLKALDDEIVRFCWLDLQAQCHKTGLLTYRNTNLILKKIDLLKVTPIRESCAVSEPPAFTVGLDMPMKELKTLLLEKEVRILLLAGPRGCGKTTLVEMLCQDNQIKGTFKKNILFVKVSKTPDVRIIVQRLFSYKVLKPLYQIRNEEDAIDQLPQLLEHIGPDPILLILDDVRQESLLEKFESDIPNYKILVTSRTVLPRSKNFRYDIKRLNEKDAMTLFCHSANPINIPEEYIIKMVGVCGGIPLLLKVTGCSLLEQRPEEWGRRLMERADDLSSHSSDTELLDHLQNSLEFPDDRVVLENCSIEFPDDKVVLENCFMDLALFPEDQRIPAAAFIDMWAELYELDEDGNQAIANLQELTNRTLASLVMARKDAIEFNSYYNDDFVTQHDLLRELAVHESSQEPAGQRPRLIVNISGNNLPKWWMEQKQFLINARLLSISTDELFSCSWCNIQAPKVEVLVLNFQTKNYSLPEFVDKMDELKVLIVTNYGFFHAELSNFQLLGSLRNLKRIRLEKVSVSSLCKTLVPLKSLKKISLFMCNIDKAFENCTIQFSVAWPNLTEINIDYCNDLEELPIGLCDIVHLKKLIITNCHQLSTLPKGIGNLVDLEVLRFRSCTDLSELPESVRSLHKLGILDIFGCLSISKLPKHIGELCNLKMLDMRGCLSLRNSLPESTVELQQLELVVCDKEMAKLWESMKEFLTKLKVEVAEKDVNLNWLFK